MKKYFVDFIFACAVIILTANFALADNTTQPQANEQSYIFNISYEDAQDAISKALTEKFSSDKQGQNIAATINGKKNTPLYSSNKPVNVEIRGLRTDTDKNNWNASLIITENNNVISAMPLAGRYGVMTALPVLKHAVKNGELISEADIELKSFPETRTNKDIITDSTSIIGKTPVRAISPDRPIRSNEIAGIALIKKNALIQIRYKSGNMEITATGQALSDGAKGDVIEIRNVTSKKTTRAVVVDSNIADVIAQGSIQTSQAAPVTTQPINY